MRCTKCGHELVENACFCNQCGEPVIKMKVEKRQWNDRYTICVLITVLVASAGIGLIYKNIKSKSNSDNNNIVSAEDYIEEKREFHTEVASNIEFLSPEETFFSENTMLDSLDVNVEENVYLNIDIPFKMTYIEHISATSALSEYNMEHSADRIIDGDVTTAWVEGVAGQGKGETITVFFDDEYLIHGFNINGGYQKSAELYNKNSRPADMRVSFSDGTYELHTLRDVNDSQDIVFSKAIVTDSISLTVESVYPGIKYEDTAISEIYIY